MSDHSFLSEAGPIEVVLSNSQRDQLGADLADLTYPQAGPFRAYLAEIRARVSRVLTPPQHEALAALSTRGVLVIDNLPRDHGVTRGPADPEAAQAWKATSVSEAVLCGFVEQVGRSYAVVQEGRSLVSNVAAKQGRQQTLTGLGAIPLDLHIENSFGRTFPQDRAPKGLALVGVCAEPGRSPATPVADGLEAIARMSASTVRALQQPDFLIRRPQRWRSAGKSLEWRAPVLTARRFTLATYGDMIEATTPAAEAALQELRAALAAVTLDLVIEPGRLVLIDNERALHGRRGYAAAFTPEGSPYRWLQRLFWTDDLANFGAWRVGDEPLIDVMRED